MILANGCNITKSEKFKGVWILSVPTVYTCICVCVYIYIYIIYSAHMHIFFKRLTALLLLFKTVVQVGSHGLVDRALDLKPEVTQGCGFESRLRPRLLPGRCTVGCPHTPVWWVKCREHISLLIILYIIVYVTNKAHLSLICICLFVGVVSKQKEIYRYQPKWVV